MAGRVQITPVMDRNRRDRYAAASNLPCAGIEAL